DPNFNLDTEYYEEEVSFALPLKLLPDTKDGRYQLKATANWVTCNDRLCLPPKERTLTVDVAIGTGAAIAAETRGTTGNDREHRQRRERRERRERKAQQARRRRSSTWRLPSRRRRCRRMSG